ncbi:hypothetical protein LCGC14_0405050 [marine sediment metagenome]|uniref:Phage virion morphogenesis protein n=1 Tax=marine sediment metagenome TaxID=412755 RepID=A0A0F9VHG1_9ZZZZ
MSAGFFSTKLDRQSKKLIDGLASKEVLKLKKTISDIGKNYRRNRSKMFSGAQKRDQNLAWKPLNPLTIEFKKRKFGSNKGTLIGSGRLARSIIREGSEGNISKVSDFEGEFGTNVFYAKFHFTGLPNRRVKSARQSAFLRANLGLFKKVGDKIPLPKRDPISPNKSERKTYGEILKQGIIRNLKAIGIEVT